MIDQKNDNEKNGLFIPARQLSAWVALAVSLLCVAFMAGYFFGKKQMVDQFVVKAEQDSFADQIYASLCALYDQDTESVAAIKKRDEVVTALETMEKDSPDVVQQESSDSAGTAQVVSCDVATSQAQYYAQLIGYGTKKAAERFVQKLQNKGISVHVKVRNSQTAQGRKTTWYQVVTQPFSDRDALESLTQRIAHDEKIQGIQIIAC